MPLVIALAAALATGAQPCNLDAHHRDVAWLRAHCQPLSARDDPHVDEAHALLRRLEKARGLRPSELLVLGRAPRAHAYVTSDRVIVVTRQALDLCYAKGNHAPSNLAFVLAHELAHLSHGDAQSATLAQQDTRFFEATAWAADANELKADASALLDVARIGLEPKEILGGALLRAWSQSDGGRSRWRQRKQRLARISTNVVGALPLFDAGVDFVAAGQHSSAADLLDAFVAKTGYEGAEVLNDLGFACLQEMLAGLDRAPARRFLLPGAFDARTFARRLERGASGDWPSLDPAALEPLLELFNRALSVRPDYLPARLNKATVMLLSGHAASVLDLLENLDLTAAEKVEVGMARALALYLLGQAPTFEAQRAQAVGQLRELATGAPTHVPVAYNLARLLTELKQPDAPAAWRRVLALDPPLLVREAAAEALARLSGASRSDPDAEPDAAPSSACAQPLPADAPRLGLPERRTGKGRRPKTTTTALLPRGEWQLMRGAGPPAWRAYRKGNSKTAVVELVVERLEDGPRAVDLRERHGPPESELTLADGKRVLRYRGCAFVVAGDMAVERLLFTSDH